MERYDAGLLNDYGGGDVEWWQDYIRAELERAYEFYLTQKTNYDEGFFDGYRKAEEFWKSKVKL